MERKRIKRYINVKDCKPESKSEHIAKRQYVKCFGKYIPVTNNEIKNCKELIISK